MKTNEYLAKHKTFVFILVDLVLITSAVLISFLLRFDGYIPAEKVDLLLPSILLAVVVTIPSLLSQKIYRLSWSYVSLTDIPRIFRGVIMSTALFGAGLYMFRIYPWFNAFPRSVIILYGILLFLFITGLRFSKRIYWQLIKGELSSEKEWESLVEDDEAEVNTVLIAGGAGYIGSVLTRKLLSNEYEVKVVDKLLFGKESIEKLIGRDNFKFIKADVNNDDRELLRALEGVDVVVDLAAIVGDPACAAQPEAAIKTNYKSTIKLAEFCKKKGIRKFLFASTCSNYGSNERDRLEENSNLRPVSLYAESKIYTEKELRKMTDQKFKPLIFRFSTAYGLSPRMRFDLVVNLLTKKAWWEGEITIFGGEQWRPFVHVKDVARALFQAIEAPYSEISGQIFNVGSTEENYQIKELGKIIKEVIPEAEVKRESSSKDNRTYNVSFEKIEENFDYETKYNVKDGVKEIYIALQEGKFPNPDSEKYRNYNPEQ